MNNIALSYLLNLLARRDYSVYEIQQKMRAKAFSEAEIETVIEHCQHKGWQSDQRFCQHFVLVRSRKGYGPLRIRQELQQ
ncbi:regulatory protein RecX, partial [Testudinibacter sp. TR-2022]